MRQGPVPRRGTIRLSIRRIGRNHAENWGNRIFSLPCYGAGVRAGPTRPAFQHIRCDGRSSARGECVDGPEAMAIALSMPILVVDDYNTMIRIIRNLLRQLGFEDVDDASDGSSA